MNTKFEWSASESAPSGYPMKIIGGDLFFPKEGSLYIPDGKTIYHGWGNPVSSHVVGEAFKPLPDAMEIAFFSFAEDRFYAGSFDLPYEKILALFNEGFFDYSQNEQDTYRKIVTGVAPGGLVNVWVRGFGKQVLVFSGKAEQQELPWTSVIDNPDVSRKEFVDFVLAESLGEEKAKAIQQAEINLDLWDSYNEKYRWVPMLAFPGAPELISRVEYFNGEMDIAENAALNPGTYAAKPAPKLINFFVKGMYKNVVSVEVAFDEREVFSGFEQLKKELADDEYIELHLNAALVKGVEKVSALLRYKDQELPLEKVHVTVRGSGISDEQMKHFWNSETHKPKNT